MLFATYNSSLWRDSGCAVCIDWCSARLWRRRRDAGRFARTLRQPYRSMRTLRQTSRARCSKPLRKLLPCTGRVAIKTATADVDPSTQLACKNFVLTGIPHHHFDIAAFVSEYEHSTPCRVHRCARGCPNGWKYVWTVWDLMCICGGGSALMYRQNGEHTDWLGKVQVLLIALGFLNALFTILLSQM
jgi:hypothetical protein